MALSFLVGALALAPGAQDASELRWKPNSGEKLSYEYKLETLGAGPQSRLTAYLDISVTQKGPGGYTTRTVSRGALLTMTGADLKDTRQNPVTARFGLRGELLEILEGMRDRGAYDLGRTTKFVSPPNPVKPGDSWTFEYPAEGEAIASRWTARYEGLVAGAQPPRARVSMALVEAAPSRTPFTARGEWEVELSTGRPMKLKADITNLGGISAAGSIRLNLALMTGDD